MKTATDEKPQAAQQLGNEATRMRRHPAIPLTFPITLRSLLRFLWFPKPLRFTGERSDRAMPLSVTSDSGYSTAATARPQGAMRAVILDGEDGCRRGDPIAGVVRLHAECLGDNPNLTSGHPSSVGLLFSN